MVMDQVWKIVMKDHEYDLAEMQMLQLTEKLSSIRKEKNSMCKLGSLIVCIFFYIKKYFPGIGNFVWEQDEPMTRQIN